MIIAAAVGGGAWAVTREDTTTLASTTMAEASVGTYSETVTSTGTFQPARTAELAFAVSGEVTSVAVEEGDVVEAGQILATVDTETLEAELAAAEANLDAAQEQLDSDTDADASATQLAADEASVTAAQSRVALAEEALAKADLTSTISGTVASVDLAVGDEVSGGDSGGTGGTSGPATGMSGGAASTSGSTTESTGAHITVITTDAFIVETSVGSADLGRLKEGLQAEMTPSDTTDTVYGTVSSVGMVASSSSSGSATFPVQIEVTGEVEGIYAGGSADVSIIVSQRTDVLTVPTAAVTTSDDGETTVTIVAENGEQVETQVEVGTSFGAQTEIASGLSEGDQVVVSTVVPGRGGGEDGDGEGGGFPGGGGGFPGGGEIPGGGGFPGGGGGFPGGQGGRR